MSPRLVIHRKPHPTQSVVAWRWFTYGGRDFGVNAGGPGYGYEVFDLTDPVRVPMVRNGYMSLDDVRTQAPTDIEWWLEQREKEAPS